MIPLAQRRCRSYKSGGSPLSSEQARDHLAQTPGWTVRGAELTRTFTHKNYYQTVAFVNAVAWIAHTEDHHPEIVFGYKTCTIRYTTHDVGGLSENDFICAAKINDLIKENA